MMEEDKIIRGNVFIADLNPTAGSEQSGRRPVVVLSNDLNNKYCPTILIAPFTKIIKKRNLPTHIYVKKNYYLKYNSMILLEQLRTIDKSRLIAYKGKISEYILSEINNKLIDMVDIDIISYLRSFGIGGNNETKTRLYSDYYSKKL